MSASIPAPHLTLPELGARTVESSGGERRSSWKTSLIIALWGAGMVFGLLRLAAYGAGLGPQAPAPALWPSELDEVLGAPGERGLRVIMSAHPRCPCTQASLRELERIAGRSEGQLHAQVLFFVPEESAGDARWSEDSILWEMAATTPGVEPVVDVEGRIAEALGAQTSGHVVVYDAEGRLRFQGGVTGARGHEGDNAGEAAVLALVRSTAALDGAPHGAPETRTASVSEPNAEPAAAGVERIQVPVFGCTLEDPERAGD